MRTKEAKPIFQPLFARSLTTEDRELLQQCLGSSTKDEVSRARVILLSAEGKTAVEISNVLGFHPSNIKKWIRKFNQEGPAGIAVKKRGPQGGPRPRFDPRQIAQILELSKSSPAQLGLHFHEWTPQKLATVAVERGIVDRISHVTVRQLLRRNGAVAQKAGHTYGSESDLRSLTQYPIVADNLPRLQKGREAFASSRYGEAVELLRVELEEGPKTPEEEAGIRLLLTRALEELSRYEDAYQVIGKYEEHSNVSQLSARMRARMRLRVGWVHSWLWNYPKAIAALNEARKLFLELEDELGLSEANYALGRTYNAIDEFRIARDHLLEAISIQRSTKDRELLARIYDQLGTADFNEGAFSSAYENYKRALELAESSSNANLLGMILINLGTAHDEGYMGERIVSEKYFRRAIECLSRGGHTDYLAFAYNNLANNLRDSGQWEEAIESLNNSINIALRFPDRRVEATARITLAEILCARGESSDAESHLSKCIELIGGRSKWLETNALLVLARVYSRTSRRDEAIKALRQALRLSTSVGDLHGVTLAQVELAEFHYEHGGFDQAREYLELAQARLKEEKSLFISGLIQRLAGKLEAARGRLAEAKQHIAQSISIFTTTDIPYEVARSHYEMGLLLLKSREQQAADANLNQAKRFFEEVAAKPDLDLVAKALDAIAAGEQLVAAPVRLSANNDVLLMQRLIEASASRELLLQELAAVVYENFPMSFVVVAKMDEIGALTPLVSQGISLHDAELLCDTVEAHKALSKDHPSDCNVLRLGNDAPDAIALCYRSETGFDTGRLQPLLRQAELGLETCSLRASARYSGKPDFDHRVQTIIPGFICCSSLMFDVVERIHKIRTSDVTVLITGESGTGKELIARAIHAESARARAIFLPFNCTATPKEIIDSQLFGHRRGSFTGATANYPGIIKAADGGTLFLDEIGDLSLEVQPKLMRFLQESEIQPLGETKPLRVDVRVLAATNTDLERAVEEGRFREDLFHRLNIIRIHVPPLRDRREEVPVLAAHFLDHFATRARKQGITFTSEAIAGLSQYDWPGNVRQLRNEIERMVAYSGDGSEIRISDLSPEVNHRRSFGASIKGSAPRVYSSYFNGNGRSDGESRFAQKASHPERHMRLKEATAILEKQLIEEALVRNRNNLSRTAIDLGLSRRGLRLKLGQLGIQRDERV